LFEPVEAVPAVAHHLAGLADVAELLGQFQQPSLHSDDLLFLGHIMISVPPAGGPRFRPWGENRDPPSGSASETNNDRQIKFELIHHSRSVQREPPRSTSLGYDRALTSIESQTTNPPDRLLSLGLPVAPARPDPHMLAGNQASGVEMRV